MAFIPVNFEEGQLVTLPMYNGGSSASYSVGQALAIDASGFYTTAAAGQNTDVEAVCMEAGTVTTNGTLLKCVSTRGVRFLADTAANPAATQQGTYVDLSTAFVLDTTASTDDLFYVEKIVGPLANKKVQGFFQHGTPLA
jgi:hypothetical protein